MWIVLHPETDVTIQGGFAESLDAVTWIEQQRQGVADARVMEINQLVVAPFDPERLT